MTVSPFDQDRTAASMITARAALLALGDAVVFLIFSWLGRNSHHEAADVAALPNVVGTAAPFLIAWFAVAGFRGMYTKGASTATPGRAVARTALTWCIAGPLGLALRALILRRGIPPSFAIVALLTNLILLLGWRGLAALLLNRER